MRERIELALLTVCAAGVFGLGIVVGAKYRIEEAIVLRQEMTAAQSLVVGMARTAEVVLADAEIAADEMVEVRGLIEDLIAYRDAMTHGELVAQLP